MNLDLGHQIFAALAEVLCIPGREDMSVTCRFSSPGIYEVRFVRHGKEESVSARVNGVPPNFPLASMLAHEYNEAILRLTLEAS